jgi:hypothetical protein
MNAPPKWFLPVAIAALLWNALGCAAYLGDVRMTAEDLARLSAAQQALYAARPAWSVAATAIAVWGGALGCVALILRRRFAVPLLAASLAGVVVQDVSLFGMLHVSATMGMTPVILQALVFAVAVALLLLARRAASAGWLR